MTEHNPYEAPKANPAQPAAPTPGVARPSSPLVFGIISLVFAAFGMLSPLLQLVNLNSEAQMAMLEKMGMTKSYLIISTIWGVLIAILLLITGLKLIKYREQGRKLFVLYAWLTIIGTIVSAVFTFPRVLRGMQEMVGETAAGAEGIVAAAGIGGAIIGTILALVFPVLGLIILNRPKVKSFLT